MKTTATTAVPRGVSAETERQEGAERYRVQSLGRALDLLELVAARGREGARLTDLALAQGLSKAATYAILQTLLAHGFVADAGAGANLSLIHI